jgi:hypothetical protein
MENEKMGSRLLSKKDLRELGLYVMGALIVLAISYITLRLFSGDMPTGNRDAIMLVIGYMMNWGGTVVQYFFGSSKGSADKTEQMSKTTPQVVP